MGIKADGLGHNLDMTWTLLGTHLEESRDMSSRTARKFKKSYRWFIKQEPENVRFKGECSTRNGIIRAIQSHFSLITRYKRGRLEYDDIARHLKPANFLSTCSILCCYFCFS